MSLSETEATSLADSRGEFAVYAEVDKLPCWLLVSSHASTIRTLAECLNTDSWDRWCNGQLAAFDCYDVPLFDTDTLHDWSKQQPVRFVSMASK